MTFPIHDIKQGIQEGNWVLVCRGYTALTGESVEPPATSPAAVGSFFTADEFLARLLPQFELLIRECVNPPLIEDATESTGQQSYGDDLADLSESLAKRAEEPAEAEEGDAGEAQPAPRRRRDGDVDLDKFRVQHGKPKSEKGVACELVPHTPGKNEWKDDGTEASEDIEESRKLSQKKSPAARRPKSEKVKVSCVKCEEKYLVNPAYAGGGKGDDRTSYVCDGCIKRGVR